MQVPDVDIPDELEFPAEGPIECLDVRNLGPPKPLTETLEILERHDGVVLQVNDRPPQHLYPKLDDRGYTYETAETDQAVLTAIW